MCIKQLYRLLQQSLLGGLLLGISSYAPAANVALTATIVATATISHTEAIALSSTQVLENTPVVMNYCVSGNAGGTYTVTYTTSESSYTLNRTGGSGTITYSVKTSDDATAGSPTWDTAAYNTAVTGQATQTVDTCDETDLAGVQITTTGGNTTIGSYTGTLIITISAAA